MDNRRDIGGPAASPDQPIAWRAVPPDTEVRSGGRRVGTLYDMLGSNQEDIFHGIVVRLESDGGKAVFVPADNVSLLTPSHVDVDMSAEELRALPEHTEEREFDIGVVGLFHRLGWKREKDR